MYKLSMLVVVALALGACSSSDAPPKAPAHARSALPSAASASVARTAPVAHAAVRDVVERFGTQMQQVSELAPPDAMRPHLKKVYGDLLTPDLLQAWLVDPSKVIGREVSSPWPAGIDINKVQCTTPQRCFVRGSVRYITSNEVVHGGVAERRPVRLRVERQKDGDWRIAAVEVGGP